MKRLCFLLAAPVVLLAALPAARVTIRTEGAKRIIESNGLPDHKPGEFPRRGNPNSISAQDYKLKVPAKPVVAAEPTASGHAFFGVAVNGVPFEPGTAEFWNFDPSSGWKYEAMSGKIDLGLDEHNAHVQPTGAYHYHGLPVGLIQKLGSDDKDMKLIGWAADGFPIYTNKGRTAQGELKVMHSSWQVKKGQRDGGPGGRYDGTFTQDYEYVAGSGDLDECNGMTGPTPEFPEDIYHYHVTSEFPQLSRYWRGTADESFQKKGPPPGAGRGGPPGRGGKGPGRRGGPGGPPGAGGPPPQDGDNPFLPPFPPR